MDNNENKNNAGTEAPKAEAPKAEAPKAEVPKAAEEKKPFYKKGWFWITTSAVLAIVGGGAAWYLCKGKQPVAELTDATAEA